MSVPASLSISRRMVSMTAAGATGLGPHSVDVATRSFGSRALTREIEFQASARMSLRRSISPLAQIGWMP
jgi:hypothetical protein